MYEESGDSGVLPGYASKSITVNGDKRTLTPKQYEEFSRQRGQITFNTVEQIVKSKSFKTLATTDQVASIAKAYRYATAVASLRIFPEYQLDGWMRNAFKIEQGGLSFGDQIIALSLISRAEGEADDYGNTVSGSKKQNSIELMSKEMKISSEKARMVYEMLISYKYSIEDLDTSARKRFEEAKRQGYTDKQFLKAYNAIKLADKEVNKKGETIPKSLKRNQKQKLIDVGFSVDQANDLLDILKGDIK